MNLIYNLVIIWIKIYDIEYILIKIPVYLTCLYKRPKLHICGDKHI